jgi:hypothetical protein
MAAFGYNTALVRFRGASKTRAGFVANPPLTDIAQ